jgi:HD-GYP domain-containing protein (c-di-GMP phosphodiesterase class II)
MARRTIHYITACIVIIIYGGQVCPFLESLTLPQLAIPVIVLFFILFWIQILVTDRLVSNSEYQYQSRRLFQWELFLFLLLGLILAVFNTIYFQFPIESGLKYLVALALLGFFAAVDLSLEKEWNLSQLFARTGRQISPDDHYFSQPKKFGLFATIIVCLIIGVIFLIINKDMDWLINVGQTVPVETAQKAILIEFGFVAGIILIHVLNLVISYSRNLQNFLGKETSVLQKATMGDFNTLVPISSNDEFGIMAKHTNLMVEGLKKRTEELQQTQDTTILTLASLAETRDNETGNHILRTQRYVKVLAEELARKQEYSDRLSPEVIDLLFKSAPLHDIGKVGIPDHILLKPGKLEKEEFDIMQTHAQLGGDSLEIAEKRLGSNFFLRLAREIAMTHHEKWDGSGYPNGLKGEEIPLSGRLMAVADVYDALISKRVYKPAFPHEKASEIILKGRGSHFDPDVVDVYQAVEEEFKRVAREFGDAGA